MEYLYPVPEAEAKSFQRAIADCTPAVAELADCVALVHARGAREQPWWGPPDDNPANVMRGADGRIVITDVFYADGPNLYAAALEHPELVVRAFSEAQRRHMTEIPLSSSGGWVHDDQERMRVGIAVAEELAL